MRVFSSAGIVAILACSIAAFAADSLYVGTWKLNPEKSVSEGAAQPVPKQAVLKVQQDTSGGMVGTVENASGLSTPLPVCIQGCTGTLSPDGRTFTQTAKGTDPKTGKGYGSVLVWEKQ